MAKRSNAKKTLAGRIEALDKAAELASGRLSSGVVDEARRVTGKADRRLSMVGEHTVIALAGSTGSGKSSLFNAISGTRLAEPGLKRPTTNKAMAGCWGEELPQELLDWLNIPRRHLVRGDDPALKGLVLIDMPDYDSTVKANQVESDRLVKLVDMLIWVVDPQKYADAALHNQYLSFLSDYGDVMLVVLNQADRLNADELHDTMRDLRRLLDAENLNGTRCVAASALTGRGIETLRQTISATVGDKQSAASRLSSDVFSAARALSAEFGENKVAQKVPAAYARGLNKALAEAAGSDMVCDAVIKSMRHRGGLATGWPVTRWLRRFRPDPLRRLHLDLMPGSRKAIEPKVSPVGVQRTSLSTGGGVQVARMETALYDLAVASSEGLPPGFADAVREATLVQRRNLPDELDRSVAICDLEMGKGHGWWKLVDVIQWILFVVGVIGAGWLLIDWLLGYLQLGTLPAVRMGRAPLPTVLLLGAAVAGAVVSLVSRIGVELGARAKGILAERALSRSIVEVADRLVIAPVNSELKRFNTGRELAKKAMG